MKTMKGFKIYACSVVSLCFCICLLDGCSCYPEFNHLFVNFVNKAYSKMREVDSNSFVVDNATPERYFTLQYNLSTNKISYVFTEGATIDTLTVGYTTEFYFKSKQCGYVQRVKNVRIMPPTSFKKVDLAYNNITIND